MAVLVTGAGGLVGTRIVQKLLDRKETVICLDRDLRMGRLDHFIGEHQVMAVQADVTDLKAVVSIISGNDIDRVIHTAAILPPTTENDPLLGTSVNIVGTNNVFEASRVNGVKRVVYPSSISTYRDQSDYGDAELDEDAVQRPYSIYGATKLVNEFTAQAFSKNWGLDCRGLRIPAVLGHGRETGRTAAASQMISRAAVGEAFESPVPAEQCTAYAYVDDVAELMVQVAFSENLTRNVYCMPAHRASLGDIADKVRRLLPKAAISFLPATEGFIQINRLNGARLIKDLGYQGLALETCILAHINEARRERQLPTLGPT